MNMTCPRDGAVRTAEDAQIKLLVFQIGNIIAKKLVENGRDDGFKHFRRPAEPPTRPNNPRPLL